VTLTTIVSSQIVRPGATIFDRIRVRGLGKRHGMIDVELFGPFATRAAIRCSGTPFRAARTPGRDGVIRSPAFRVARAGFYAFRERLLGRTTKCPLVPETSFAAPAIITGRGDHPRFVAVRNAGGSTPTRVRVGSLGIDVPVAAIGVDLTHGVLGVPSSIGRTGWWRDGMAPGASAGAILIAGHKDSATAGAGAFFALHKAHAGQGVEVTTAAGRTYAYRVVSVRSYPKSRLPIGIWSPRGRARLVLVTCGGPFSHKHYRDNVVVTAVPAG
jgi:hypothetical protein